MRQLRKWQSAAVCLLALSLLPFAPSRPGSAQSAGYTVTDIGTLGGTQSAANGIDSCGRVVGTSFPQNSTSNHPFIWSGGQLTDLGTFGGQTGAATAINSAGAVSGLARTTSGGQRPFIWTAAAGKTDLGTLGGAFSAAFDLNDSNQVVGQSETAPLQDRGFVWEQATGMQALPTLGGPAGAAGGVNNAGKIVGKAQTAAGAIHAFVLSGGVITDLGTLGGDTSEAHEISEGDRIVGYAALASNSAETVFHAFISTTAPGSMTDLGTLGTGTRSVAYDVNASEQVVGWSETAQGSGDRHAFIWTLVSGMQDLNTLAPGTGWTFQEARSINDSGQIVGVGLNPSNQTHAFLLTPTNTTPPPCPVSPGVLQFDSAAYGVSESGGTKTIKVNRLNGGDGTVTVNFETGTGGTATAGDDYTSTSGTLTFGPGVTSQTFNVAVNDDATYETNETVNLTLSGVGGGATLGAQNSATLTITNDDAPPSFSISDVTQAEGNSGTTVFNFTVTKTGATALASTVSVSTADGTAQDDNPASEDNDYQALPAGGFIAFGATQTTANVSVLVNGDAATEPNETFFVNLSGATGATIADAQGLGTITNDDNTPTLQFSQSAFAAGEGAHFVTVTVTRAGDTTLPVSVDYATSDGTAGERRDYTTALGTLRFAAGDASKTFDLLLTDDAYQESSETINLTLSNQTGGAVLGARGTAAVVIADNDNAPASSNPIDSAAFFVRQHYHDFLNREPDADGLAFWTNQMTNCSNPPPADLLVCRINVSAAFFLSIEFQETGYLVQRVYKTAYGDAAGASTLGGAHQLAVPVVRFREFLRDTQGIGQGVVVGQGDWQARLGNNKQAFALEFVQRQRFTDAFPSTLTADEFVSKLDQNAGAVLSADEKAQLVGLFGGPASSSNDVARRAAALRQVAEHATLRQRERNRAFVLMQFFGYLRRNPDDPQDRDYTGYDFWLTKLNDNNGNFEQAEMVKAFLSSIEYRQRFAP